MEEEQVTRREFQAIGITIGTSYEWQSLALEINNHFNVEKKLRPLIFKLCKKFPLGVVKDKFKRSKEKDLRYFIACFRKREEK